MHMFNGLIAKINNSLFLRDRYIVWSIITNLIALIFLAIFLFIRIKPLADAGVGEIPLHYNVYFGIDLIGAWYQVFIMPALGFIILAINSVLAYNLYLKEKILSYSLIGSGLIASIFLIIAGIFIVLINA